MGFWFPDPVKDLLKKIRYENKINPKHKGVITSKFQPLRASLFLLEDRIYSQTPKTYMSQFLITGGGGLFALRKHLLLGNTNHERQSSSKPTRRAIPPNFVSSTDGGNGGMGTKHKRTSIPSVVQLRP